MAVEITREEIIEAIRLTAKQNGDRPLGFRVFTQQTGITRYQWGKYWAKFTDAQKEAGFEPNSPNLALKKGYAEQKYIAFIRRLGKFPTISEIRVERYSDPAIPKFPSKRIATVFALAQVLLEYSTENAGYEDITEICRQKIAQISDGLESELIIGPTIVGEVYLYKQGQYYKIGKTNNLLRRGKELKLLLPEEPQLIHSIKTDDPTGVEAYWHKRFGSKRSGKSEFFTLNVEDVRAFKRWKQIF